MAYYYNRESIPGISDKEFDEFYIYVYSLVKLLFIERVNPDNDVLYCPNDDATFEMMPKSIKEGDNNTTQWRYQFKVRFTLPFKYLPDEETNHTNCNIDVNLSLTLNQEGILTSKNLDVSVCTWIMGIGPSWWYMLNRDLLSIEEIEDGLRIFLASLHNFYICPYDGGLQYQRLNRIKQNYQERYYKYVNFIKVERPNHIEMMNTLLSRRNPIMHALSPDTVRSMVGAESQAWQNTIMREVTSQGV